MTIVLIGCGRMGLAMVRSWRDGEHVIVVDPAAPSVEGVERLQRLEHVPRGGDLTVVLAVKPQTFRNMIADFATIADHRPLVISVMAGITLSDLSGAFAGSRRIARVMPNSPAAIGAGISGAVAAEGVGDADRRRIGLLLDALGATVWLDREQDLDLVTAVSGSGPAYMFRMTEALSEAGVAAGLPADVAMRLARATLIGSASLAQADPRSLADLRREVTSPGGTTEAGLARMDAASGIDLVMTETVAAAACRSRQLAY